MNDVARNLQSQSLMFDEKLLAMEQKLKTIDIRQQEQQQQQRQHQPETVLRILQQRLLISQHLNVHFVKRVALTKALKQEPAIKYEFDMEWIVCWRDESRSSPTTHCPMKSKSWV